MEWVYFCIVFFYDKVYIGLGGMEQVYFALINGKIDFLFKFLILFSPLEQISILKCIHNISTTKVDGLII